MEVVVQILMLIVLLSTLLKMSFVRWGYVVGYALCLALFLVLSYEASSLQTKTGIAQYLTVRELREHTAIFVTIESVLFLAFAFGRLGLEQGGRQALGYSPVTRLWQRLSRSFLTYFCGFLIVPVLFYIQTSLIFALPGVDFAQVSYALATLVALLVPALSYLCRRLLPEEGLRLELLFIISALVFVLGIITTVDEQVRTAPEVAFDWRGGLIALSLFGLCFLLGVYSYQIKLKLRKLKLKITTN
ncbi:MAG: hypothetical protein SPK09_08050 [Porphyromonas sp.]|nr:hypothetical protein [Porphyromonas sp.]